MTTRLFGLAALGWCMFIGTRAIAATISGVCPDGSAFIVSRAEHIPCARAKLVRPEEMPPLRPDLLPRPYKWMVDQETRDPSNPYNIVDEARRIRELRAGEGTPQLNTGSPSPSASGAPGGTSTPGTVSAGAAPPAPTQMAATQRLTLGESDLRDLVKLVSLRQQVAPAQFVIEDVHERPQLYIQLAWSSSFEAVALGAQNLTDDQARVLVFTARAAADTEFHPNFLIAQSGATYRPDPLDMDEVHFLVGKPGKLAEGRMAVGYLRIPARFDPVAPLQIYWNDRSIDTKLH